MWCLRVGGLFVIVHVCLLLWACFGLGFVVFVIRGFLGVSVAFECFCWVWVFVICVLLFCFSLFGCVFVLEFSFVGWWY